MFGKLRGGLRKQTDMQQVGLKYQQIIILIIAGL